MTPPQQLTARFEEKVIFNDRFIEFSFELDHPHRMSFEAGQYVSIKVADSGERRSYSISSSPATDHGFQILVDISPGGLGSQFLNNLNFGDQIELLGPMGQFSIAQNDEQQLVLIATGSGVTPFKSMLADLLENKAEAREITLYWGMRYVAELFWENDIQDWVETHPNFHFYPTISRPVPEWNLSTGHVTDLIFAHQFPAKTGFYLCGNREMIDAVQKVLLEKGVESQYIHHEKFY